MMYRIFLQPKAKKDLEQLQELEWQKVLRAFARLEVDPWSGKKLGGELAGLYAMRAWPFRIIYRIEKKVLLIDVIQIAHRKDVYR